MQQRAAISPGQPDLTGCRILLVEDEYFIADDICRALKDCGAEVVGPASDLSEGLKLAQTRDLACAVLDINLHGESGFRIAEALNGREVPFVYCTGYEPSAVPLTLQGAAHLVKPIKIERLVALVARLCGRSGL